MRRLAHPAASVDPGATAKTYRVSDPVDDDYPFEYLETASARAGITEMQAKLTEYSLRNCRRRWNRQLCSRSRSENPCS